MKKHKYDQGTIVRYVGNDKYILREGCFWHISKRYVGPPHGVKYKRYVGPPHGVKYKIHPESEYLLHWEHSDNVVVHEDEIQLVTDGVGDKDYPDPSRPDFLPWPDQS